MLKSYASYFVAYLLNNLETIRNIERIVLFGSAAKEEAEKDSDIDIFIEVKEKTKKFEKNIREIEKRFYESRESAIFKIKGIENHFDIKIGKLMEWKDLYKSIASTGIILFGPYEASKLPEGVKHSIIIFWEKIGKNRGAFLNKLYGFKIKNKFYPGLLIKYGGRKIGKSCILIPVYYKKDVFNLIEQHKVKAKSIEIFN